MMRQLHFYFAVDEAPPPLGEHAVHVWHIRLDGDDAGYPQQYRLLSDDERQQANRYQPPWRRRQFVSGRYAMRSILARYAERSPIELSLRTNAQGKPYLADGDENALQFNLSHSRNFALLAVSSERPIGIDVEYSADSTLTPDAIRKMTATYFTPPEQGRVLILPAREQRIAFLRLWTRKEALLKAHGLGMTIPANAADALSELGEHCQIEEVPLSSRYTAAIAQIDCRAAPSQFQATRPPSQQGPAQK